MTKGIKRIKAHIGDGEQGFKEFKDTEKCKQIK
jgi:hypothetical protein